MTFHILPGGVTQTRGEPGVASIMFIWDTRDPSSMQDVSLFKLLLLSFASTLFTAKTAQAPACQFYHHDNQDNHSNKESHDIK